jgi:hypothetical protein
LKMQSAMKIVNDKHLQYDEYESVANMVVNTHLGGMNFYMPNSQSKYHVVYDPNSSTSIEEALVHSAVKQHRLDPFGSFASAVLYVV